MEYDDRMDQRPAIQALFLQGIRASLLASLDAQLLSCDALIRSEHGVTARLGAGVSHGDGEMKKSDFLEKLRSQMGMDREALRRFDLASNHPYECKCKLCKEWWEAVGPESEENEEDYDGPVSYDNGDFYK